MKQIKSFSLFEQRPTNISYIIFFNFILFASRSRNYILVVHHYENEVAQCLFNKITSF